MTSSVNLNGRLVNSTQVYGGVLSLQQSNQARRKLTQHLMGVTLVTHEVRIALDAIASMWASRTWSTRARLWERFQGFCTWRRIERNPIHAVTFLQMLPISVQTRLTYGRNLMTLFNLAGANINPLKFFVRALQAEGAGEPMHQMTPLTPHLLCRLRSNLEANESVTMLICWKSASRWSETASLRKENFVEVNSNRIIIWWGRGTKTSRCNPWKKSMYTVISGQGTLEIADHLRILKSYDVLCRTTVRKMDSKIRDILGAGFGTHSAKRGAITMLFREVAQGKLTLEDLKNLAKHQEIESLLRYNSDPVTTALALGTAKATSLLKTL